MDKKYPDDSDDFTYELMVAIVGEKNMLFERPEEIEKPMSMSERMKAAKETSKEHAAAQKRTPEKEKQQKRERTEVTL